MNQTSSSIPDYARVTDLNRKQAAKRIRQIYACLARLASSSEPGSIPEEAAIEMQHALAHLALMCDTEAVEQKARRWHQALSHLNRAVIDFLKLFILQDFPQKKSSVEFMSGWLKTRQKEYREHASGTQSPGLSSTAERELFAIEEYSKLLNFAINDSSLDFTGDHLKGDNWQKYSMEIDNWMNSDLMYGAMMAQKNVVNLKQLLDTLWSLNAAALANCNFEIQVETLKAARNLGKANNWHTDLWDKIDHALAGSARCPRENILQLYREFLRYFGVTPWQALS